MSIRAHSSNTHLAKCSVSIGPYYECLDVQFLFSCTNNELAFEHKTLPFEQTNSMLTVPGTCQFSIETWMEQQTIDLTFSIGTYCTMSIRSSGLYFTELAFEANTLASNPQHANLLLAQAFQPSIGI